MKRENIIKAIAYLLTALGSALFILFGLSSCNVTRTITTTASSFTRGDTAVNITTKTVEMYDAKKVVNN